MNRYRLLRGKISQSEPFQAVRTPIEKMNWQVDVRGHSQKLLLELSKVQSNIAQRAVSRDHEALREVLVVRPVPGRRLEGKKFAGKSVTVIGGVVRRRTTAPDALTDSGHCSWYGVRCQRAAQR